MQVNDEEVKFDIINTMKFPIDSENCNAIKSFGWDYYEEEVIANFQP